MQARHVIPVLALVFALCAACGGGNVPRPAAGQEGRHQGFYPLNSHFLLFLSLAQIADM